MVSVDRFTREIIKHRLYGVVEEAFIALESVSGSMVVTEGHDVIVALFTPEGKVLYAGTGVLQHIVCAAEAVKNVIEYFSKDPGIFEDDALMVNDPYSGALHAPDVFIIQPIYFSGRLIAFVASFVHVIDNGSIEPGGFCPSATECFHEGFQTKGLKIIERGKLRRDVWDTIMNMSRVPHALAMDYKSQISAGFVAKQRMVELLEDFGADTVQSVGSDLIVESEQLFRQRLLEIPDGIFRTRRYFELGNQVLRIEVTATKERDRLAFDFTGTDPQVASSVNSTKWATRAGLFPPIFTLLAWDITWNDGILRCVNFFAPEGTLVNCRWPAASSLSSIGIVTMMNQVGTQIMSKMLGATEKFKNRATADWLGVYTCECLFGRQSSGEFAVLMVPDSFSGAGGGRPFSDGIDIGGDLTCIVSRTANMESGEAAFPMRYLYRRLVPDSGGPGKYRGGCSQETAQVSHGSPDGKFTVLAMPGTAILCPATFGTSGGLPGCSIEWIQFRDGNVSEYPNNRASTRGEREEYVNFGSTDITGNDILYIRFAGGGGYGDPLDREPELVLNDVLKGLVTPGPARDIYGVLIDLRNQRVDFGATRERRLMLRKERLGGRGQEVDVDRRANVVPSGRRINEYLQVVDSSGISFVQCTWCGKHICRANKRWKDNVITRKVSVAEAGPGRKDTGLFFMLQFFCPCCATQLDIDVVYRDDPPLYDDVCI